MSASKILRERREMAKEVLERMHRSQAWSLKYKCLVCGEQINSKCWVTPEYVILKHIAKHSKDEMVTAMIKEAMEQS